MGKKEYIIIERLHHNLWEQEDCTTNVDNPTFFYNKDKPNCHCNLCKILVSIFFSFNMQDLTLSLLILFHWFNEVALALR